MGPKSYVRFAEASDMMLARVEDRGCHHSQFIMNLRTCSAELEETYRLLAERNTHLMRTTWENYQTKKIVGQCEVTRKVIQLVLTITRRPIDTFILGPTRAGKEVIVKAIHFNSPRREGPFVAANYTAIPDSLFENEVFGIEKDIVTGINVHKGLIGETSRDMLFLDELAGMILSNQAKLLRVLEGREVLRVGSSKPVSVDIKLTAATNTSLGEAVRKGNFREDLYYRTNVAETRVPPLRDRGDNILLLAQFLLERHCIYTGRPRLSFSPAVCRQFLQYGWPGNVRELNNEVERAVSLTIGNRVKLSGLSMRIVSDEVRCHLLEMGPLISRDGVDTSREETPAAQNYNLREMERKLILNVLNRTGGNKSKAAEPLGVTREGPRERLLRMGINDREPSRGDDKA